MYFHHGNVTIRYGESDQDIGKQNGSSRDGIPEQSRKEPHGSSHNVSGTKSGFGSTNHSKCQINRRSIPKEIQERQPTDLRKNMF